MAPLNNRKYLKAFRKKLRSQGTSAEAVMWTYLKGKKIAGIQFRRQHSIGKYNLDFYAPSKKIAIELDGEAHNWDRSAENDYEKELFLQSLGITILRFENTWFSTILIM
jgi:very-short-patch-repair endonuclease